MAKIVLGESQKQQILRNVERAYYADYEKLDTFPNEVPTVATDELMELVLPDTTQQKIISALGPGWELAKRDTVRIDAYFPKASSTLGSYRASYGYVSKPVLLIHGTVSLTNVPGVEHITYANGSISFLASDSSLIQQPNLKAYVDKIEKLYADYERVNSEAEKARKDMSDFLDQYSTLQQAVKAFGPALLQFVPSNMKELYNKPTEKRVRKPNPEKSTIDVSSLVARATTQALQLN